MKARLKGESGLIDISWSYRSMKSTSGWSSLEMIVPFLRIVSVFPDIESLPEYLSDEAFELRTETKVENV